MRLLEIHSGPYNRHAPLFEADDDKPKEPRLSKGPRGRVHGGTHRTPPRSDRPVTGTHLSGRTSHYQERETGRRYEAPDPGEEKYSLRFGHFDDTVMAMAGVEGWTSGDYDDDAAARWWERQYKNEQGTATAARMRLDNMLKLHTGTGLDNDDGLTFVAAIDGFEGNRWHVYLNGTVKLAKWYNRIVASKARAAGFTIED